MNPPRRRTPSPGFIAVCLTYTLVVAFFLWGFSTPALDRVWTLHHQLKIGSIGRLEPRDREIILDAARRHPKMASALLSDLDAERGIGLISAHSEGWIATPWATVLRTGTSRNFRNIVFDIQTPKDLIPFSIVVLGSGWQKKISVTRQGVQRLEIPPAAEGVELITIGITGRGFYADPSVLSVRITFAAGQQSPDSAP